MSSLFKELKGKDIRIKTWNEMLEMENTSLYEGEIQTVIYFLDDNGEEVISFTDTMRNLCGKVIHVDENMIKGDLFLEAKRNLIKDRELLYYDDITNNYYYLDIDMFEVIEVPKLKALEEPELKDENEFYVIEETTGKRIFCGTREECFKYYKTHVDIFKNQFKRIAVLRSI